MRWAARLLCHAVNTLPPVRKNRRKSRLRIQPLEAREMPHVTGLVFLDYNQDGGQDTDEPGVGNVTVTATDDTGATESVSTQTDGTYTLTTDAQNLRLVFSGLPTDSQVGRIGGGTGPIARFLTAADPRVNVNLGLNVPFLVTSQFNFDRSIDGVNAGAQAVVELPYGAVGQVTPTVRATMGDVGSVFGLAYQPTSDNIFASAFLKRHAGFGPDATGNATTTGGIYRIDRQTGTIGLLLDVNATAGLASAGADPHPAAAESDGGNWFHDAASLPLVGKRSLGGLAISADGRTLYTINLSSRQLLEIPLNLDGTRDTTRNIRATAVPIANPAGSGITGFDGNDMRPFAVAVQGTTVYVGVTYTAESGAQTDANLRAFVFAFNPAAGSFSSTPVLSANLTYARGDIEDPTPANRNSGDEIAANWRRWINTFDTSTGQQFFPVHPQPWLTSIAFDGGSMVLGIRDRFGDQAGFQTGNLVANDPDQYTAVTAGDILRAGPGLTAGTWQLESAGAAGGTATGGATNGQGPGNGEFYFQDGANPTPEDVTTGAVAMVPGFSTVASTGSDPLSAFTGGVYTFRNSGANAGQVASAAELVETFDLNTFGAANALGGLAVAPAAAIQAGDRVFQDTNNNGLQDAGEPGLNGVTVRLFLAGTEVDSVVTGTGGDFLFDTLLPSTDYEIRIARNQSALTGRTLAQGNQGTNDQIDSDAALDGTQANAVIAFTTGTDGTSNHSLDAGFSAGATATSITLGNLVYLDANNNGTFDGGDTPIDGVVVELVNPTGPVGTPIATTTTANGGLYSFTITTEGDYRVRLAPSNFTGTGVLVGARASTAVAANPNDNVNNDNNGSATGGLLGDTGFIISGVINLTADDEPTNDGDTDNNTNLSLDFGVTQALATGPLFLGNLVFQDLNGNSLFDSGTDNGIGGVTVELIDPTGTAIAATTTTNSQGGYVFANIAAGDYAVRLAPVNFNTGRALFGLTSAAISVTNANNDLNNDNNGSVVGTLGTGGSISSSPITLSAGGEPINDGDTDNNTNFSLDFGLRTATVAPGTLSIGNQVFNDANNNGTRDAGETGIAGVAVRLFAAADLTTPVGTTTTDGTGLYVFRNLNAGDYVVELADTNFLTGAVLAGFTASAGTAADPDSAPSDTDNNGTVSGTLGQTGGVIRSAAVTLAAGTEPTSENPNNDTATTDSNSNLTVDFGVNQPAVANTLSLGDRVFRDANSNGTFDGSEAGIPGVAVELINNANPTTVIATQVTATGGSYRFNNLAAGDYVVRLAASNFTAGGPLVGFTSSPGAPDPDNNINNDDNGGDLTGGTISSLPVTLALTTEPTNDGDTNNNTNLSLDFGVVAPVVTLSLGSAVFNDANNNGTFDSGESGVSGVTVQLVNSSGTVVATTTTGTNGVYSFTGLAAGDYRVRLPATNFTGTGPLVGFTSSSGSNGSAVGPYEGTLTPDPDNDADNDDNGQVSGSLGTTGFIESSLITLSAGAEPTADGDDANANQTLDLGVFRKFSVGNVVFNDANNNGVQDSAELGIGSVVLRLLDAGNSNALVTTTTTNAQGQYLFTNLLAGSYVVEVAATNFNAGGPLFSFQSSTGTGNAFEPPTANTTDKNDDGNTSGTLGTGGVIQSGSITLGNGMPTGENPNNDPTTPDNQSNLTVDFGVFQQTPATARISGRVILDHNNNGLANGPDTGIAGVTITLSGGTLSAPVTVTTDATGNFNFTNLAAGTYTLTETQPTTPANVTGRNVAGTAGGTTTTANIIGNIVLGANEQATGYTFAEIPTRSLTGAVYEDTNGNGRKDASEPGIPGVVITLTGTDVVTGTITAKTATTDSTGTYTFANLVPGTYTLTEAQPSGYSDGQEQNGVPVAVQVTNDKFAGINTSTAAGTTGGYNFGEIKTGGIAGVVFDDTNGNGTQDTGETGIGGVKVRLTGTNNKGQAVNILATTAANGAYSITNLLPGTYKLVETQPTAYRDGTDKAGTAGGNATAKNDEISNIVLNSSASATGYTFAERSAPDLVMTQSVSAGTVAPGGLVVITYRVRNTGSAVATAAEATVNLGGLVFVSASVPEYSNTTKKWTIGDLAAGATKTFTITARVPSSAAFAPSVRATTTATEVRLGNNAASSVINAAPPPPTEMVSFSPARNWFLSSFYPTATRNRL